MSAVYNEHDKAAAAWLRELIANGLIAPGEVDERSIKDITADDYRSFTQVHLFAGVGVWSHALRRAGWSDARPVLTGSCPCQPFSAAGAQAGFEDPRHLWPDMHRLIVRAHQLGLRWADCILGEQVATAGLWLDLVCSDLEALGYAFGSPDLPAAGFAGAHIRQRIYWVADADNAERWADLAPRHDGDWPQTGRVEGDGQFGKRGVVGGVAVTDGRNPGAEGLQRGGQYGQFPANDRAPSRLANDDDERGNGIGARAGEARRRQLTIGGELGRADWIGLRDGSWRPVEARTFPLAPTSPGRVGLLRGYGNALDAETATQFIAAYMEAADLPFAA